MIQGSSTLIIINGSGVVENSKYIVLGPHLLFSFFYFTFLMQFSMLDNTLECNGYHGYSAAPFNCGYKRARLISLGSSCLLCWMITYHYIQQPTF